MKKVKEIDLDELDYIEVKFNDTSEQWSLNIKQKILNDIHSKHKEKIRNRLFKIKILNIELEKVNVSNDFSFVSSDYSYYLFKVWYRIKIKE